MELYVFNADRELLGVIEAYEHLQWTRKYNACGGFTLRAIADADNLGLLQMGHILWKSDDVEAGIIDHIELNAQEQEYITISGCFATGLLGRRIIWQTEMLQGNLSTAVAQLLSNHVIVPTDPDRVIQGVSFASEPLSHTLNMQVSYRNLLATIEDMCSAYDVGLRTAFDPVSGLFTVTLYEGHLTSAVFSKEFGNLTEQVYTTDTTSDILMRYRANEMIGLLEEVGKIPAFSYPLMLKTLDRVEVTPAGKLTFQFQSGIRVTV